MLYGLSFPESTSLDLKMNTALNRFRIAIEWLQVFLFITRTRIIGSLLGNKVNPSSSQRTSSRTANAYIVQLRVRITKYHEEAEISENGSLTVIVRGVDISGVGIAVTRVGVAVAIGSASDGGADQGAGQERSTDQLAFYANCGAFLLSGNLSPGQRRHQENQHLRRLRFRADAIIVIRKQKIIRLGNRNAERIDSPVTTSSFPGVSGTWWESKDRVMLTGNQRPFFKGLNIKVIRHGSSSGYDQCQY